MKTQMSNALKQGDSTPVVLQGANNEVKITSVELVELINTFRKEEGNTVEKEHYDLIKSINKEVEALKNAGIAQGNFSVGSYKDKQNQERPCYSMNKAGALQMLNKESAVVRYKTVQYIDALEGRIKEQRTNPYSQLSKELQAIFAIDHKQQEMEYRITKLENTMTIDYGQQNDIKALVAKKVISVLGGADAPAYNNRKVSNKAFSQLHRWLRNVFEVNSYKNIAVKDFERAKEIIPQWEPSEELQLMIKGANAQIRLA